MDILKSLELPDIDSVMVKIHSLFEQYTNKEIEWTERELLESKVTDVNKILTIICDIYDTFQKAQLEWSFPLPVNNKTTDQKTFWKYDHKSNFIVKYTNSALTDAHIIAQYIKVKTLIDRYHNTYNEHFINAQEPEQLYAFTEVKEE